LIVAAQPKPKKYRFAKVEDPFLETIRTRADGIVAEHETAALRKVYLKALFFLAVGGGAYVGVFYTSGGLDTLALAVLAALALTMLPINIGHDAAHFAAAKSKLANNLILLFSYGVLGISGHLWRHRHIHNHHMFPNLEGADTDIEASILLRFSPKQRWLPFHRLQPLYAPLLYGFAVPLRVYVMDFFSLVIARREDPKIWRTWEMTGYFWGTKAIHVFLATLPLALMDLPFLHWLGGYLMAYCASSMLLLIILIGTHIHEDAAFPEADEKNHLPHDWGRHVVLTSCDWAPESEIASFFFGGLNAHTAHHLLPNVNHGLYTRLSLILAEESEKAGLPYNRMSLVGMLRGHYAHLKTMSRPPRPAMATGASPAPAE
jgi:linoleoyl-CoA desaturase